jgi:hypothetical protein
MSKLCFFVLMMPSPLLPWQEIGRGFFAIPWPAGFFGSVLTCRGFADSKTDVEHRECLHRFSLLKASTETYKNGFFQFGGGFLYDYGFKINPFLLFYPKGIF